MGHDITAMTNDQVKEVMAATSQAREVGGREFGQPVVPTPGWLHSWLGIDSKPIQANYDGLFRKYQSQAKASKSSARFASAADVQEHVEHVLTSPDIAIPATSDGAFLLVRNEGGNKSVVLEVKAGKQQHQIISAMILTETQVSHKVEEARRQGGHSAVLVKPPSAGPMVVQHRDLPPSRNGVQPGSEIILIQSDDDGNRSFEQTKRGSISFQNGQALIRIFKDRDLSTMLHETSHLWLEEMVQDAAMRDAPQQIRDGPSRLRA